jgi:PIN domain nuclease of toxin-antitoxin system
VRRLLLDTHALLWFIAGDERLSSTARREIENEASDVFVSVGTAWEIAIKVGLGKLSLDAPTAEAFFIEQMKVNAFRYLPIEPPHVFRAGQLPLHHRDPFDRILIAQALVEDMGLVTREDFRAYAVVTMW